MADTIQIILLLVIAWFIIAPKRGMLSNFIGTKRRKIILDSCALIDGRIVEVVNSRFMADELVIPQFIVNELQMLADGNDSHKRERARFGLDIAHQLQDASPTPVMIDRTVFTDTSATDDKLILLAKKVNGVLCTTDYNLSKVAAVEGLQVLNVNELAQSLRPIALPGETLKIKILQKGSNRDQGVGYLDDGTMIVVDGAARHIGKLMPVTVTRMHQTVAGKMVFGQVREEKSDSEPNKDDKPRQKTTPAGANGASHASDKVSNDTSTSQRKLHGRLQRFKRKRPLV